jgi:carboxy-cis,cis-muconate cyclase
MGIQYLVVGTFNTSELFLLSFDSKTATFKLEKTWKALGNHSWLALDPTHTILLATCWAEIPSIATYQLSIDTQTINLLHNQEIKNRSGYVTVGLGSAENGVTRAYTAGGRTGEVLAVDVVTGKGTDVLQEVDYISATVKLTEKGSLLQSSRLQDHLDQDRAATSSAKDAALDTGSVLDFGGLRHGAHSADLSPDGSLLYVADIGNNCVWVHQVDLNGLLSAPEKIVSPRHNDGPRHVWPHPAGKAVYVVQEHTSIVDVFLVNTSGGESKATLEWVQGVRIIPESKDASLFWADEVRTVVSSSSGGSSKAPEYLIASTRGLEADTMGYVAVFSLTEEGLIDGVEKGQQRQDSSASENTAHPSAWLDLWQTPTSGGWANAVGPCPHLLETSRKELTGQYAVLTDSEEGLVTMLAIEKSDEHPSTGRVREVARLSLGKTAEGVVRGAATAVWL